jgi:hypothetical protein
MGTTTLLLYAFQPSLPTMKKLTVHQDIDINEQRVIQIHENRVSMIFYFDQQPTYSIDSGKEHNLIQTYV